jgi:hypothetical protein
MSGPRHRRHCWSRRSRQERPGRGTRAPAGSPARREARGITIVWAHLEPSPTSPPHHVSIVDVPGRDFVKTWLRASNRSDLPLLVVAADDGWMPADRRASSDPGMPASVDGCALQSRPRRPEGRCASGLKTARRGGADRTDLRPDGAGPRYAESDVGRSSPGVSLQDIESPGCPSIGYSLPSGTW